MAWFHVWFDMKKRNKVLSYSELNIFCEQIALVLKAGISVYEGLCILGDEASSAGEKVLYKSITESMDKGVSFPGALDESEAFPQYMINMLDIGEVSGRLDTVLEQLGRYYKREQSMRDAIKYAVSYPVIMMVMMALVIGVLVGKVLPIFSSVFAELGSELTGFSKTVMELGTGFSTSLGWILGIFIFLFIAIYAGVRTNMGKKYFVAFQGKFFLTKKLANKIAVSRFSSGMSLMLASGLDTEQSLDMILPLIEQEEMVRKVVLMREDIREGMGFAEAVAKQEVYSQTYTRMIGIGYRAGAVDEVIENISIRYETEIENSLSDLIAVIEPSLVAVLSIIVGVILLSVMLPLMSIMSVI